MLSNNYMEPDNYLYRIKELLKCYPANTTKSKLLCEKLSDEISQIPEFMDLISGINQKETKEILYEFSSLLQKKEYNNNYCFQKILCENSNNIFTMILKGSILEVGIKYIKINVTFKEYILYLTKIYLLEEKCLYMDILKKNIDVFPFGNLKNLFNNINNSKEEKKNYNEENCLKYIDIINIGKEIDTQQFFFNEELEKIKKDIKMSKWKKFEKVKIQAQIDQEKKINSFFELYNHNLDINKDTIKDPKSSKETNYSVYLPYFFKKRILKPISFIGDLNYPFQTKNYSSFFTLDNCFVLYIDKSKLNSNRVLFKYSYRQRLNYISEKILTKHFIFKNINIDYINKFSKYFQIINLNNEDPLFHQGELNQGIYIITKGSVKLISNQSYKNLIDLNYLFIHSTDYCSQYISEKSKKDILRNKSFIDGYYKYNSKLNKLMKNPIFTKNSKIKEDITFCTYNTKDILGLGEIFNYKNNINLFTAKAASNNTELIFIPREIFQALISNDIINQRCGSITEEKTRILKECINKYKTFFENKMAMFANRKKIKIKKDKNIISRSFLLKNNNPIIKNFMEKVKKINFNIKKNTNINNKNINQRNKNDTISYQRNTISLDSSIKNNKPNILNDNSNKKNSIIFSLKQNLLPLKPKNNILLNKSELKKIKSEFPLILNRSNISQRNLFMPKNHNLNFNSENINNFLNKLKKDKIEKYNIRCSSSIRYDKKQNLKNRTIFYKNSYLCKSNNDIDTNSLIYNNK